MKRKNLFKKIMLHAFLIFWVLITIYPILWVIKISFSPGRSLISTSLSLIPAQFTLANFQSVIFDRPFFRWFLNSAICAVGTTALGVFLACTAAYAYSRFRFPGRRQGMMTFLITQMFPGTLMIIPQFILMAKLGLLNQLVGLIVIYSTTAIPFCVWILKGYFDTIPIDLEESALIDGASRNQAFWYVILPLARPAIAITALFSFMTAWNEYILAATFMQSELNYTLPVGLRMMVGEFASDWGLFAAASLLISIPVVALFMSLQKYLISGLTAGAVKG
jgi:arabinogalactan oligomer/maltooligosaccharide transport system permease protein